jgi:hypothetical protein
MSYAYSKNGLSDSGDYYFNKQLKYCYEAIRLGLPYGNSFAYYDIAGVYAFMREKNRAYENLTRFYQKPWYSVWIAEYIKLTYC